LFESLALSATGVDWGLTVGARAGTAVIHILNTALMGWALTMAWNRGRYATLGLTYLLAITIHGLWNGLAILSTFNELLVQQGLAAPYPWMAGLSSATPVGLGVLALAGIFILFNMNRLFRQRVAAGRA
jgi:hypothetical protein